MFEWLIRRILRFPKIPRFFYPDLEKMNAQFGGKPLALSREFLGNLPLPSGTLALGDIITPSSLEVSGIASREVGIYANIFRHPAGFESLKSLILICGDGAAIDSRRKIGEFAEDGYFKIALADRLEFDEHWFREGEVRLGTISTHEDSGTLRALKRRFGFKTVKVSPYRTQVVGSISEAMEAEIYAYLRSLPDDAGCSIFDFRVAANDNFDRANEVRKPWAFIPMGKLPAPPIFICNPGWCQFGACEVIGEFADGVPQVLTMQCVDHSGD